jgi:hypothetical protein
MLPDICMYEVGGQTAFPVYAAVNGGLCREAVLFPMYHKGNDIVIFGYYVGGPVKSEDVKKLEEDAKSAFINKLNEHPEIKDSTEFPKHGEVVRLKYGN